jgi:hypothetical protein
MVQLLDEPNHLITHNTLITASRSMISSDCYRARSVISRNPAMICCYLAFWERLPVIGHVCESVCQCVCQCVSVCVLVCVSVCVKHFKLQMRDLNRKFPPLIKGTGLFPHGNILLPSCCNNLP